MGLVRILAWHGRSKRSPAGRRPHAISSSLNRRDRKVLSVMCALIQISTGWESLPPDRWRGRYPRQEAGSRPIRAKRGFLLITRASHRQPNTPPRPMRRSAIGYGGVTRVSPRPTENHREPPKPVASDMPRIPQFSVSSETSRDHLRYLKIAVSTVRFCPSPSSLEGLLEPGGRQIRRETSRPLTCLRPRYRMPVS